MQAAGYSVTAEDCTGYAINVACRVDMHAEQSVQQVIDQTLDGYYTDAEGYTVPRWMRRCWNAPVGPAAGHCPTA